MDKEKKQEEGEGKKEEDVNLDILKTLKKGESIDVLNFETKDSETSPPSRYNSGSIILAMESRQVN